MKLLLRADLDTHDGDAIDLIAALSKRGVDVHLDPLRVAVPLPADVAVLLTKTRPADLDLQLHLTSPVNLEPGPVGGPTTVAWVNALGAAPAALNGYDLVVGYHRTITDTLADACTGVPQATIHGGYHPRDWSAVDRDWHGDLRLCVLGNDTAEIVRAYAELRERYPDDFDGVELTVKTNEPVQPSWIGPGIVYADGYWDDETTADFYADHHVMIAPPRIKDTPALQFLSTGGTVVASRRGGSEQWLSTTVGYPVDWDMTGVGGREAFQATVHHVVRHRDEARIRGTAAASLLPEMCGWDPVVDRLLTSIANAVPGRGERLVHTARVAAERAREKTRR